MCSHMKLLHVPLAFSVLVSICLGLLRPAVAQASPLLLQNNSSIARVCAAPLSPLVICTNATASRNFTGFVVELFRDVADSLGATEGVHYKFSCVPFDWMLGNLTSSTGNCDIGIGAITITLRRQAEGIKFSYPIYQTGLGVVVKASSIRSSGWGWIQPFGWSLWLAVGLTILIFPLLLLIMELGSLKKKIYRTDVLPGYLIAAHRSLLSLIALEPLEVSSFAAKLTTIVFIFMSLIISNTYTANLAAALTVTQINSHINNVDELRGKAVASNSVYLDRLRSRYGIIAIPLDNNDPNMYLDAVQSVIKGDLTAIISDFPLLRSALIDTPGCGARLLPDVIEPFSYGFAFRPTFNDTIISAASQDILDAQENGRFQKLTEIWLGVNNLDDCGNLPTVQYSIGFGSLYGLWVVLGASLILGFVFMVGARFRRKKTNARHNTTLDTSQLMSEKKKFVGSLSEIIDDLHADKLDDKHGHESPLQTSMKIEGPTTAVTDHAAGNGHGAAPSKIESENNNQKSWLELVRGVSGIQKNESSRGETTCLYAAHDLENAARIKR